MKTALPPLRESRKVGVPCMDRVAVVEQLGAKDARPQIANHRHIRISSDTTLLFPVEYAGSDGNVELSRSKSRRAAEGFMQSCTQPDYTGVRKSQSTKHARNQTRRSSRVFAQCCANLAGKLFQRKRFLQEVRFQVHNFVIHHSLARITRDE